MAEMESELEKNNILSLLDITYGKVEEGDYKSAKQNIDVLAKIIDKKAEKTITPTKKITEVEV